MNDLSCGVRTCAYNSHNLCMRDNIKVEGANAMTKNATFCSSFDENKERAKASCDCEAKKDTNIACDAVKCAYNESHMCTAKHVDVSGSHAMLSSETECATFKNL